MARADLERRAWRFADRIQHLLNSTVTDYVSVRPGATTDPDVVTVGTSLSKNRTRSALVDLITADRACPLYLDVRFLLTLDDNGEHLAVRSSYFGVLGVRDVRDVWFHYDYELGKAGYPDAHLQIYAGIPELEAAMRVLCRSRKKKQVNHLHFPIGGRRASLDEVIQFLVDEELVVPKDGWEKELERFRESTELALLA